MSSQRIINMLYLHDAELLMSIKASDAPQALSLFIFTLLSLVG